MNVKKPNPAPTVLSNDEQKPAKPLSKEHAHAHGKSQVSVISEAGKWKEGVKIDQSTINLFIHPIAVQDGATEALQQTVDTLMDEETLESGITGWPMQKGKSVSGYVHSLGIKYEGHHLGSLHVCPVFGGSPFIKIGTYHHQLERLYFWKVYHDYLAEIKRPEIMPYLFKRSVTRLDFALDVAADPTDYVWLRLGAQDAMQYHGKEADSVYLGSETSAIRFCVYNKKVQLAQHPQAVFIEQPHMLRAEIRLKGFRGIPNGNPHELKNLKNPWAKIYPIHISAIPQIITECQHPKEVHKLLKMGLHDYLRTFGKGKRSGLSKKLRQLPSPSWWNPEEVWADCLQALSADPLLSQ